MICQFLNFLTVTYSSEIMQIQDFENIIISEIKKVVVNIIAKNPTLPIAVKKGERQGDAISKFLETNFVKETQNHQFLKNSSASPTGKTKNPYDVETFFVHKNHKEKIWIDFKAVNVENQNTNPDSGTPNKVFELMLKFNSFYLLYVVIYYTGLSDNKNLQFVDYNNEKVKAVFLKDVENSMHITPANQIQFNAFKPSLYRTREQFIEFLFDKLIETNQRKFLDAQQQLELLKQKKYLVPSTIYINKEVDISLLKNINCNQENIIKNL